jgi:hypothetical protein
MTGVPDGAVTTIAAHRGRESSTRRARTRSHRCIASDILVHNGQARLFLNRQTATERAHIVNAFRFELSRVQTPDVRERMISGLMNVDREVPESVAGWACARCPRDAQGAQERRDTSGGHVAVALVDGAAKRWQHQSAAVANTTTLKAATDSVRGNRAERASLSALQ